MIIETNEDGTIFYQFNTHYSNCINIIRAAGLVWRELTLGKNIVAQKFYNLKTKPSHIADISDNNEYSRLWKTQLNFAKVWSISGIIVPRELGIVYKDRQWVYGNKFDSLYDAYVNFRKGIFNYGFSH